MGWLGVDKLEVKVFVDEFMFVGFSVYGVKGDVIFLSDV